MESNMAHRIVRVLRCKIIVFVASLLTPRLFILFEVFMDLAALSLCCCVWNSLVAERAPLQLRCLGSSLQWFLLLQLAFSRAASVVVAAELNCPAALGTSWTRS